MVYKEFSGILSLKDCHVYEFLQTMQSNFKIAKTSHSVKATICKNLLRGGARLAVPDDCEDFSVIAGILLQRYGSPVVILQTLLRLHANIGRIPSRMCAHPNWPKIEDMAKSHMFLLRRAETLSVNQSAIPQIYNNSYRNHQLMSILPHESLDQLKIIQNSQNDQVLYQQIALHLDNILRNASSNNDMVNYESGKKKFQNDDFGSDNVTLAYERRFEIMDNTDCPVCKTLDTNNKIPHELFKNHLYIGPHKKILQ